MASRGGVVRGGGDQAVSNLTTLASTTSFLHPQGFFLHRRHQQKTKIMPLVVSEMRDHPMKFPFLFFSSPWSSFELLGGGKNPKLQLSYWEKAVKRL